MEIKGPVIINYQLAKHITSIYSLINGKKSGKRKFLKYVKNLVSKQALYQSLILPISPKTNIRKTALPNRFEHNEKIGLLQTHSTD